MSCVEAVAIRGHTWQAVFEAVLHVVLAIHTRGLAHCALQPDSFRLYDGTSWRLVNLESCTPFGEPTPRKCPVCFAPPEVATPNPHAHRHPHANPNPNP